VPFSLETREVWRLLGYLHGRSEPSPRVRSRIEEMLSESRELVRPRGTWAVEELPEVAASGPFRGAEQVAFLVCTIGPGLERRVAELSAGGETLRALVLDAIGSASVEAVTDVVNAAICKQVGQAGVYTNRRISPGYRGWPIDGQLRIFGLLPSRLTGVRLRPTCFMEPRKSISAAVSIGRDVPHSKYVSICGYCSLEGCAFRRRPDPGQPDRAHG
jgi:hypothetical protein